MALMFVPSAPECVASTVAENREDLHRDERDISVRWGNHPTGLGEAGVADDVRPSRA